ncbi:UPF0027 protein [Nosema bombycis CQ1]|uniref:3'-phosphate/5'-hydroxy nucleic acid ligase n=1 Tax=Nosema bombycis (strain CQ1 / CVCC 102059) TaxID=578461 RepID=R0M979_NOSB1|nr:UPF0027 protein [Nosema bombycis CQ1]|eukprot:EOB14524.1 UPF0027 protein [Nosema bombycis CQ1]
MDLKENNLDCYQKGLIVNENSISLTKDFDKDMKTTCKIHIDGDLQKIVLNDENLLKQIAEIAKLPGIVGEVLGLPDIHYGYGFPIGSVVAFDMDDKDSIIAPGGVGYDINCGVRALTTNLNLENIRGKEEEVAQDLFDNIPSGLGIEKIISQFKNTTNVSIKELNCMLDEGLEYLVRIGAISRDNLEFTENNGKLKGDSKLVSQKAKGKGSIQLASLGSGNHYLEIQYVSEIYEEANCRSFRN